MAYLDSNEPYSYVDSGIGSGVAGGAAIGASLAMAAQMRPALMRVRRNAMRQRVAYEWDNVQLANKYERFVKKHTRAKKLNNKLFGSGKAKLLTYGASMLGGAVLGGVLDYYTEDV